MNTFEITPPQIENVICPRCRKTWMNKNGQDSFYFCYACSFILFDRQIKPHSRSIDKPKESWYNKKVKDKLYAFFDSPWVAFPLSILALILFIWLSMKLAAYTEHRPSFIEAFNG